MKHNTFLATLALFTVFAIAVLLVLLGGAGAYARLSENSRAGYDSRTAMQYVTTKIHQAPTTAAVSIARFGDSDALVITEKLPDADYSTRIYCYDGWLMELFAVAGDGFAPEDGERLLPMDSLALETLHTLTVITLTDSQGRTQQLKLYLPGSEVAAP